MKVLLKQLRFANENHQLLLRRPKKYVICKNCANHTIEKVHEDRPCGTAQDKDICSISTDINYDFITGKKTIHYATALCSDFNKDGKCAEHVDKCKGPGNE